MSCSASGTYSLPSAFMKSYCVSTSQKMTRGDATAIQCTPQGRGGRGGNRGISPGSAGGVNRCSVNALPAGEEIPRQGAYGNRHDRVARGAHQHGLALILSGVAAGSECFLAQSHQQRGGQRGRESVYRAAHDVAAVRPIDVGDLVPGERALAIQGDRCQQSSATDTEHRRRLVHHELARDANLVFVDEERTRPYMWPVVPGTDADALSRDERWERVEARTALRGRRANDG